MNNLIQNKEEFNILLKKYERFKISYHIPTSTLQWTLYSHSAIIFNNEDKDYTNYIRAIIDNNRLFIRGVDEDLNINRKIQLKLLKGLNNIGINTFRFTIYYNDINTNWIEKILGEKL